MELTSQQTKIFTHLCTRIPKEWAYLIARRVIRMDNDYQHYDASEILMSGFTWAHTEEDYDYWLSVYDGLRAEENYKITDKWQQESYKKKEASMVK